MAFRPIQQAYRRRQRQLTQNRSCMHLYAILVVWTRIFCVLLHDNRIRSLRLRFRNPSYKAQKDPSPLESTKVQSLFGFICIWCLWGAVALVLGVNGVLHVAETGSTVREYRGKYSLSALPFQTPFLKPDEPEKIGQWRIEGSCNWYRVAQHLANTF